MPGASVTITNKGQQASLHLTTSNVGTYNAQGLLPGAYELRVEANGFKRAVVELEVEVGRVTTADVRLQVGAVTDTVTVEGTGRM